MCPIQRLSSISMLRQGNYPTKCAGTEASSIYMYHLTFVDPSHYVHKAFTADDTQGLGCNQAVLAHLSPWELPWLHLELTRILKLAEQPWS